MATIHLIDGEKGGVGKSWVARTIAQYFLDQGDATGTTPCKTPPFIGVECDRSNPTFAKIYGDSLVVFAIFSESEKYEDRPDRIFDLAMTKTVLVNLPAQVHIPFKNWIRRKNLIEIGQQNDVSFVKWFVSDGEDDSISLFVKSLKEFGTEIPHVFIKNLGRCDEDAWDYFYNHEEAQDAIARYEVKVIEFPRLSDSKRITINAQRLTFDQARQYPEFGIIGRNQIVIYLKEAYKAIESTGYLTIPPASGLTLEESSKKRSKKNTPSTTSNGDGIESTPSPAA
jgi:hypothetical protein